MVFMNLKVLTPTGSVVRTRSREIGPGKLWCQLTEMLARSQTLANKDTRLNATSLHSIAPIPHASCPIAGPASEQQSPIIRTCGVNIE